MAEVKEVTVRMSAKLYAKLGRLAEEAYESPDTFIESALANLVREVAAHKRAMRDMQETEVVELRPDAVGQYL